MYFNLLQGFYPTKCLLALYQRIRGKVSYAAAVADAADEDEIIRLAESFAGTVRTMHSTDGSNSGLKSLKELYRCHIAVNLFHDEKEKGVALSILESIPDGNTVLHGDLHFGNVIRSGGKDYFIDLGNAAYGYHKFDLAMMAAIMSMHRHDGSDRFSRIYHCSYSRGELFYQSYLDALFGQHTDIYALEEELKPFIFLRLFSIENELNCHHLPFFDRLFAETVERAGKL